nr:MAG TPA: hypothetical protein [Bacteriophage sp.]
MILLNQFLVLHNIFVAFLNNITYNYIRFI